MQGRSALVPWVAAAAIFLIHLVTNPHYGFFRDELYFIICGFHPQFGYVDQPPVIPLLSAATQLFGQSLILLRAIAALFAAAGVFATCLLVAEFGGGVFAQVLASLVFFFANVLMSFGMKVSPDTVGLWAWPLIALLIVRITKGAHPKLWLWAGAVTGISIESKYSVLFFLSAMLLGLILAPERRILFNRWFAAGTGLAILIALPNFLWQMHYGFPMLELLRAGQQAKNVIVGPFVFLYQQLLITNILLAVVWIIGLAWLLRNAGFRFVGYAYIILIGETIIFHGKHYYSADVYPIVIAAGAVSIEAWTSGRTVLRTAMTAAVVVAGMVFLPYTLPVLPESTYVSYSNAVDRALHLSRSTVATEPNRETSTLPGDWADMHGWPELAATVASVYNSLPAAERAQAVVFASNYGEASAVELFAPNVPVISEHNQYWLWGTRGYSGNVLVQIHGSCFHDSRLFASRTLATTFVHPWAIQYETNMPIWICRGIKKPLRQIWPELKTYE